MMLMDFIQVAAKLKELEVFSPCHYRVHGQALPKSSVALQLGMKRMSIQYALSCCLGKRMKVVRICV